MQSNRRADYSDIKYQNMRFLIGDGPNDLYVKKYLEDLLKSNVKVRVCEASSSNSDENFIKIINAAFEDGHSPSPEFREKLFFLLKEKFRQNPDTCVSIHCVSGLGRATVIVAMALMELGMSYEEAVELIRSQRNDDNSNSEELHFPLIKKNHSKFRKTLCSIM